MADTTKRINVQYILNDSGFNESLQGINANLKLNKSALNEANLGVKAFGTSTESLSKVQKSLQDTINAAKQKVDLYNQSIEKTSQKMEDNIKKREQLKTELDMEKAKLEGTTQAYGKNSEVTQNSKAKVQELTEQYKNADKAVETNAKSIENLTTKMNNAEATTLKYEAQLKTTNETIAKNNNSWLKAGKSLQDTGEKFKSVGQTVSSAGDKILTATVPVVALGAAGAKTAMDFESGMAKVSTISDSTQVSLDDLGKGVIKLSDETGEGFDTIQEGLYETISSGVQTADSMKFLTTAVKAAKGGFTDTATSVDGLTTVLNAYNMKSTDATKISNQMLVAQNLGKTTFGDMAKSIGLVADTTAACNMKTQDLFSSLAVETAHGIDTSEAISGLRESLSNIIKPSDEATQMAKQLGIQFDAAHLKSVGWAQFLQEIKDKTHGNTEEMGKLFGSVQGLNTMITLTSDSGMSLFNQSLQQMSSNTDFVGQAFDKVNNTSGQKLKNSLNELKNSAIKLGEAAEPLIEDATNLLNGLASTLNNTDKGTLKIIEDMALAGVAIGGVTKVVGGAINAYGTWSTVAGKVAEAVGKRGAAKATEDLGVAAAETAGKTATASAAAEGLGAAAEVGGAGMATAEGGAVGLGGAVAGLAAPIALGVAAVAALGYGTYKFYKYATDDAIPTVDLFNSKYQETTKVMAENGQMIDTVQEKTVNFTKATKDGVSQYMKLDDQVSKTQMNIAVNSDKFTQQAKTSVIKNFTDMVNQSKSLDDDMKSTKVRDFTELINSTSNLTAENREAIVYQYQLMLSQVGGISDQQKQKLINNFKATLTNSVGITAQNVQQIKSKYDQMTQVVDSAIDKRSNDEIQKFQSLFSKTTSMSKLEQDQIVRNIQSGTNTAKGVTQAYEQQILQIYQNASDQHRNLTTQEQQQVDQIQQTMRENAVTNLSSSATEQKVLLERIKSYHSDITAEEASEVIKNANKQRDESINAANKKYHDVVASAIYERDTTHNLSSDQAQKIIDEAGKQRDQSIQAAKDQRDGVVKHVQDMGGSAVKEINTSTGNMKTPFEKWASDVESILTGVQNFFSNHPIIAKIAQVGADIAGAGVGNFATGLTGHNARGTSNWQGGLTTMHEAGWEVYDLPQGTKVYNHEASEFMVKQTAQEVAKNVLSEYSGGVNTVIIPINLDGNKIAEVITPNINKIQGRNQMLNNRIMAGRR